MPLVAPLPVAPAPSSPSKALLWNQLWFPSQPPTPRHCTHLRLKQRGVEEGGCIWSRKAHVFLVSGCTALYLKWDWSESGLQGAPSPLEGATYMTLNRRSEASDKCEVHLGKGRPNKGRAQLTLTKTSSFLTTEMWFYMLRGKKNKELALSRYKFT